MPWASPGRGPLLRRPCQPARGYTSAPYPAFPTGQSRWLQPRGPRGPGKGWEKLGNSDSWVPEDLGLAVLFLHPLVQPQARALASCKPS